LTHSGHIAITECSPLLIQGEHRVEGATISQTELFGTSIRLTRLE
jgi:hypothetical protein